MFKYNCRYEIVLSIICQRLSPTKKEKILMQETVPESPSSQTLTKEIHLTQTAHGIHDFLAESNFDLNYLQRYLMSVDSSELIMFNDSKVILKRSSCKKMCNISLDLFQENCPRIITPGYLPSGKLPPYYWRLDNSPLDNTLR